jgi:hypothetical protein
MVLQHQHGPKQWCKCTAARRISLYLRGQLLDRQVNRENETLIPEILMVLQHHYGPKQWCKCTAAHRIGLHRRGQPPERQVNRENETLIPEILMVLQHHYGPKQWCKCTAAHRIGLHRRGQLLDRQVQAQVCDVDSCNSDGATASLWSQAMVQMHSGAPNRPASVRIAFRPPGAGAKLRL